MTDLNYLFKNNPRRFEIKPRQDLMKAVVTTGNGGYDRLVYRDVPVPVPGPGEVLIKVLGAGVNNTDVNTRLGWYSASISGGTGQLSSEASGDDIRDGGWNKKTPFPLIQGTDCCGEVIQRADDVLYPEIGRRVLVRPCMRLNGFDSLDNIWMGSDFDGAFAQYVKVPACEVFEISCSWSNAELAALPCSYGTAENMVHRAKITDSDHVLVTGASGGVGSAAVQLAKRRGACVTAVTGSSKKEAVLKLGADRIITRGKDLTDVLGESVIDAVIDNVAGEGFGQLLKIIARGGRYVSSGAIAGPVVSMDMRDFYLKDLNLIGCTAWDEPVFRNLINYIERDEIRPLAAGAFELRKIAAAQQEFLKKNHVGSFVLLPPE